MAPVVALNVAVVAPAATVTPVGAVSTALLLESEIVVPPAGATWVKVTVHALELLGPRLVGLHAREERAKPVVRFSVALWERPFRVAVTLAAPLLLMVPAVALKVPVADPAVIILADGTVKLGLLLASVTTLQPEGTGLFKVIAQVLIIFEVKLPGLQVTEDTAKPVARLKVTLFELPFNVAVTAAAWLLLTVLVVALKVVEVDPAPTMAEVGVVSVALLSDKATVAPPVGATLLRVIVQVLEALGPRVVGLQANEDTRTGATRLMVELAEVPL